MSDGPGQYTLGGEVVPVRCDEHEWGEPGPNPDPSAGHHRRWIKTCERCGAITAATQPHNIGKRRSSAHLIEDATHCLMCRIPRRLAALQAHHVVDKSAGGTDDPDNIWPLCEACHAFVTWQRRKVERLIRAESSDFSKALAEAYDDLCRTDKHTPEWREKRAHINDLMRRNADEQRRRETGRA